MYSIIDIESNGAAYRKERIIDVAVFKYDGHEIVDQFMSLVNPEAEITPYVQKLTKITPKMVKTAPKFHEIAKRIIEITEGTTLVGHNIDFDYRMLRQSFKELGYEFKINTLDTIPLAQKLIPDAESYSLGKLVKSLGIPLLDAHRAAGDARATLELFKILIVKDSQSEIIQTQFEETNAKTYINKIKELTQDLPNERGIIYVQNEEGKILMSDFVDDINKFAKKIFNSKSKHLETIQQESQQIHYEIVGDDLVAQLILRSKGFRKPTRLPFGLYVRNGKYKVEKNTLNKNEQPLLKFKSFTQGLKALQYLKSKPDFEDPENLSKHISLKKRNEIWTIPGRVLGEKTFILLKNGKPEAFGFYEFHTQIQSRSKIDKLKINLNASGADLLNDLQMALFKNQVEIMPLPQ